MAAIRAGLGLCLGEFAVFLTSPILANMLQAARRQGVASSSFGAQIEVSQAA
jgi:hypothetical protein